MLAQHDSWTDGEVGRQCVVRDANELLELANANLAPCIARGLLRCECDDPACEAQVSATHAEYEAVRARGSRFLIAIDHENPMNACIVSEDDRYAVVDVVAGDARYVALAQNPRHAWVERGSAPLDGGRPGDAM